MTAISRAFNADKATSENYMYLPMIDMDKAIGRRENMERALAYYGPRIE